MRLTRIAWTLPLWTVLAGCLSVTSHDGRWPCESDADCQSGERCRTISGGRGGECTEAAICRTTVDCAPGWMCEQNHCFAPQCSATDDSICGGFGCDWHTSRCRVTCNSQGECRDGFGCANGRCVPSNCSGEAEGQCDGLHCVSGVCLAECDSSSDCDTGLGCVRGRCEPVVGLGVPCLDDDGCDVGRCNAGTCMIQRSLCEGMSCGSDDLFSCGTCGPKQVCTDAFVCADACDGVQCGTVFGVDCGSCTGKDYCDPSGVCVDACGAAQCGVRNGVSCGSCSGKTYCSDGGGCVDACGAAVCGTVHGVSCGACGAGKVCDAAGECKDKVCEPLMYQCVGADRYACDSYGVTSTKVETCPASTTCDPMGCKP